MIQPAERTKSLGASVFTEMARHKKKAASKGKDMIDLSVGSPDLPPPSGVRSILSEETLEKDNYGYALQGLEAFNEAASGYCSERFNISLDSSEVLQLLGSQDGLSHLALAYLNPEDYIIIPDPGYPIYSACADLAGAYTYPVSLNEENQFMPDITAVPSHVLERTKILIMNYPGNPASARATKDYFEKVVALALEHSILIVHDFAYAELDFTEDKPLSIFHIDGAKETALEFHSLSKSFNMAGARIGFVTGREDLLKPLADIKSNIDYGVFYPVQKAAIHALTYEQPFLSTQKQTFRNRRDVFCQSLHEKGWHVTIPDGGMFVWAKLPPSYTSMGFALKALEAGVVVTPGHAFGLEGEGYVRIALVQEEERLKEAANRLASIIF
ncbi:LL-diaminopimelate aminotransferase [Sinobaca qinghaiensis]|uniref:Aminotransferase n=1 Tax=Sinobaca qinghaiensis TaxID=342944 RepID=A0A419UZC5_9BACL|nr:aminotransferase class I/II-fold pyridoxal phosphate-dependent enzyme [Sinobaca qinghaiensis]RKD71045.1 LL-diaminopimelate aminotransferase [Sinobaca qinghaiensis]